MNRINKLFRGSGRALALIFAASVLWLIFDMAALKFSLSDVNSSKLLKEELLRMERGRYKVLRNRYISTPKATKWPARFPVKKFEDARANEVKQQKQSPQEESALRNGAKNRKNSYEEKQHNIQSLPKQTIRPVWTEKYTPQKEARNELAGDHVLSRDKNNVVERHETNVSQSAAPSVTRGAREPPTVAKRVQLIIGVGDKHFEKTHQPVASSPQAELPRPVAAGSKAPPAGPVAAAQPEHVAVATGVANMGAEGREDPVGKDGGPAALNPAANRTESKTERHAVAPLKGVVQKQGAAVVAAKESLHNGTSPLSISKELSQKNLRNSSYVSSDKHAGEVTTIPKIPGPTKGNRTILHAGGMETGANKTGVRHVTANQVVVKEIADHKVNGAKVANLSKEQTALVTRAPGMHMVLNFDMTIAPRDGRAFGQFGKPAAVPKNKEEEANRRWKEGYFNVYLSDLIPVDRAIADTRPPRCAEQMVHNDLPTTSIIMCFVDEVWSTLLRSVHSVLNRSPPHLIKEIILVDDFSTKDHLKDQLDKYMSQFPKVHILHLKERHGLIRARLAGAAIATGDVLTFLDSHVECNVGWLEPLLERVRLSRTKVACPVIEVISDKDMSYITIDNFQRGIFNWPMNFGWKPIPAEIIKEQNIKEHDPIRCPVMAGGLFSIDRKYFFELGTYDPGLEVWGGENLELSFKVWMCGGEIEILPCSRVGHIFRNDNPYSFPQDRIKTVERNLARVAEVWLDEYKELFYGHGYHHLLDRNKTDIGDLTQQKELRSKLQCKSFQWYLQNVYPDMHAPVVRSGCLLSNVGMGQCLTIENNTLLFRGCDNNNKNQHFNHTWLRLIKQNDMCLAPILEKGTVGLHRCDNLNRSLMWIHKSLIAETALMDHIALEYSRKSQPTCLEVDHSEKTLRLNLCSTSNAYQKWKFMHYYV